MQLCGYTSCAASGAQLTAHREVATAAPGPVVHAGEAAHALAREALHLDDLDAQLLALSQLDSALASGIRGAFLREDVEDTAAPSPAERVRLDNALITVRKLLAPDAVRSVVVEEIATRPGAAQLHDVTRFLRSKAWGRLRSAFGFLRSPGGQRAFSDFLAGLATHPPEALHLEKVRRVLAGGHEVELALVFSHDAVRVAMTTLAPQLPATLRRELSQWEQRHAAERENFRDSLQRTLTLQTYYALYALSDEDSEAVLRFWRSAAGKWWATTRLEVSAAVIRARLEAAASSLAPPRSDERGAAPRH